MRPEGEGSFSFVVRLERDRRWRYWLRLDGAAWINDPAQGPRVFLLCLDGASLDGAAWINDPAADDYVRYADGSAVSVLET